MGALLERVGRCAMPLALAVTLLLAAQWPLRDALGAGSAQANDLAQALFALYVAVGITHAQRRGAHLVARPDLAQAPDAPAWRRKGAALCLLPWGLYLMWTSAPMVWRSVLSAERFPETNLPGYFVLKLALALLALLAILQALTELRARA